MDLCNINTIRGILKKYGFHFSKALGQNFLTAGWIPEKIVTMSGISEEMGILEIGPGIGVLTRALSEAASKVVTVEIDKKLIPLLGETLSDCKNVSVVHGDILRMELRDIVESSFMGKIPCVCANLPYGITSPVMRKLLSSGLFEQITVMVQKEVAMRMAASPGSSDYGAFSVFVGYHAETTVLFDVTPECFIPCPKVSSSVIKLTRRTKPVGLTDEELFFKLVRAGFGQRRKTLVNALHSGMGGSKGKEEICELIKGCGMREDIRGERLGIAEYVELTNVWKETLNKI